MKPRFSTLNDWLHWQESLHWQSIDLGLERIQQVARRLELVSLPFQLITVAGTNGKGSTIALMEAMLIPTVHSVGVYTSPHLYRYNERIRISGLEVSDDLLCEAFAAIDHARGDISLSYFEFSTLAAVWLFKHQSVEVAILEVGMGGRLDAVNCWDADVAVVTSIGIDHVEWLGHDRETIAKEKAGIFRKDKVAISGDINPPHSIRSVAEQLDALLLQAGCDYSWQVKDTCWQLEWGERLFSSLPFPALLGAHQINNAATAIVATQSLAAIKINSTTLDQALRTTKLSARMELLQKEPEIILDVAHNPHAVEKLAIWLQENPIKGKTYALFSMLDDKDIGAVVATMNPYIDCWYVAGLEGSRGLRERVLVNRMQEIVDHKSLNINANETLEMAWNACKVELSERDRLIVFGSFIVISQFKVIF